MVTKLDARNWYLAPEIWYRKFGFGDLVLDIWYRRLGTELSGAFSTWLLGLVSNQLDMPTVDKRG